MGKMKKIMAGIGLTACIASCGAMMTGCADMSDAQLKEALDTATKAEQTLEDLKGIISDQNTKHNADMQAYLELLEEKNAEIAKLTETLNKNGEISDEDAYLMLYYSAMNFDVMSEKTSNVTISANEYNYLGNMISIILTIIPLGFRTIKIPSSSLDKSK